MSAADLAKSFDQIADLYERSRPGYPQSVFERMLDFAGIGASARLLEVGSGTGKATLPLAQRGLDVLGLEPGPKLAEIARARLSQFPDVRIQTVSFEDWDEPIGAFDLVFIAQAFHWLAPDQRLTKVARTLRRPGALAVFGNSGGLAPGDVHDSVQDAYRRHAPRLSERDHARDWYSSSESPIFREFLASPLFAEMHCEFVVWEQALSSIEYCDLLATYSDHSTLPGDQLRELLGAVRNAIDRHGGTAPIANKTGLFLARAV